MNTLQDIVKGARNTINLLRPSTQEEREEMFALVREKVDHYQPLIEQAFGVSLGTITVKDISTAPYDHGQKKLAELIEKEEKETGKKISPVGKIILNGLVKAAGTVSNAVSATKNAVGRENLSMAYYNGALYVPFYVWNRINRRIMPDVTSQNIDRIVVHELSHAVWDAIRKHEPEQAYSKEREFWSEGFATYCADILFAKINRIYPEGYQVSSRMVPMYRDAMEHVATVTEGSLETLKRIPLDWEKYEKVRVSVKEMLSSLKLS